MDKIVGLKEFRNNVASYAGKVSQGESFVVVKRSKPLFKVTPLSGEDGEWEAVVDFIKFRRGGIKIQELLSRL